MNNAGISDSAKPVSETANDEAQRVFTVNFFASLALTREALPHIRNVKGNVIFISSVAGKRLIWEYISALHGDVIFILQATTLCQAWGPTVLQRLP